MSASRLDYTRASARPTNLSEQDPSYSRAPARAARDYMPSYPRTSTRPATAKDPEAIVHTRESRPKTAPAQATSPQPSATYSPDALAGALIREHLVSRGLRKTLEVFLQEDNEQQDSGLSGRLELAKLLGILKLVRQNRTSEPPEKSYLAIITKHLATRTVITPEDSNYTAKSRPTTATERVSERPRTAARAAPATHLDGPSRSELTPSRSTRISDRRASAREEEYIDPGDTFDYHNPLRTVDSSLVGNSSDDPDQASFAAFAKPLGSFSSSNPRAVAYENGEPGYRVSREQLIGSGDGRAGGGSGAVAGRRANRKSDERQPAYETEVPERSPSRYSQRSSSARASPEAAIDRPPQIERREAPTSRYTSTDRVSPAPYHRITPTNTRKPTPTPPAPTVSFRQPTANELIVTDDFSTASSSEEEDDIQSYKTASQSMTNILSNLHAGPSLGVGRGGTLITTSQALSLRCLVFPGDKGRSTFGEEWKGKGFEFNTAEEVRYGLVQLKGGPCGLLAAVQAFVLKHLMFSTHSFATHAGKLRPTTAQCRTALIDALNEILWQAGGDRERKVVICLYLANARVSGSAMSRERYLPDGITENMELHEFADHGSSRDFLTANIGQFTGNERGRHGVIQFLYSLLLTRGIETIRYEDMDEPDAKMIGRHGYCTQEMVNLILIGKATSNVFDGDMRLKEDEPGDDPANLLKGIKEPTQFGYLTLYEHYGNIKVGQYYKNPLYPIFILNSESHYTILFSTDRTLLTKLPPATPSQTSSHSSFTSHLRPHSSKGSIKSFDLFYYDGLAGQGEEIRLTIGLRKGVGKGAEGEEDDLVSPLEHVVRTRWPGCGIDWNGTEPFL